MSARLQSLFSRNQLSVKLGCGLTAMVHLHMFVPLPVLTIGGSLGHVCSPAARQLAKLTQQDFGTLTLPAAAQMAAASVLLLLGAHIVITQRSSTRTLYDKG